MHRWARRAHQARHEHPPERAAPPVTEATEPDPECEAPSLPPLESLDANSDYRAFLGADVPKALRMAALRKAWTSDPSVVAHRPLVEYDWDCNAPGYGRLKPNDLTGKLARDLIRHFRPEEPPAHEAPPDVELAADPSENPASVEGRPEPVRQTSSAEGMPRDAGADPAPAYPNEDPGDRSVREGDDERTPPRHGSARPV